MCAERPFPGGNFLDNGQEYYPRAVFDALELVRDDYGWTGPIHITENGMTDGPSSRRTLSRTMSGSGTFEDSWSGSRRAIRAGHDVRGYYLWSLMDNFEWSAGFSAKFGIAALDPVTLDRIRRSRHTGIAT